MARAMEIPMYQLFYDGEEPPKLPNLPKRKSSDDVAWGSSGKDARYLGKLFWPVNLSVLYPHPGQWPVTQVILSTALLVAIFAFTPVEAGQGDGPGVAGWARVMLAAAGYGAAFGLLPIGWIVLAAIFLYNLTVETGHFETVKRSVVALSDDRRIQALLIAFCFGAFVEGAAGFGTPVAISAALMLGAGFKPLYLPFAVCVAVSIPLEIKTVTHYRENLCHTNFAAPGRV